VRKMKIDPKTINILKNFATINTSIVIKPGNVLRTVSNNKTIFAKAEVPNTFDNTFGIYDLGRFISCISMFDDPDVDFGDKSAIISDSKNSIEYYYADPTVIVAPTKDEVNMPSTDVSFTLENGILAKALKVMNIMAFDAPEIAFVGDGNKIIVQAMDSRNTSSNSFRHIVGETDMTFKAVFSPENLKFIPDTYEVALSAKGVSKFVGNDVTYFVAINTASSF